MAFTRPGTTRIEIEGNEPYEITIEEPVINTNLPKRIQTGTKMQMARKFPISQMISAL